MWPLDPQREAVASGASWEVECMRKATGARAAMQRRKRLESMFAGEHNTWRLRIEKGGRIGGAMQLAELTHYTHGRNAPAEHWPSGKWWGRP